MTVPGTRRWVPGRVDSGDAVPLLGFGRRARRVVDRSEQPSAMERAAGTRT